MKKTVSLRVGLGLAFVLAMSLTAIVLGISICSVTVYDFRKELHERTAGLARTVANLIDAGACAAIINSDDRTTAEYSKMRSWLQKVCAVNNGIKYIYLIRYRDEHVSFVIDAESNAEPKHHVNDVYTRASRSIHSFFLNPDQVFVESEMTTDKSGTYLSGYAPIRNDKGELIGAIRVDVDAQHVLEAESDVWETILTSSRLTLLGILIGSFFLASRMSKPLISLASEVKRIQDFDLASETQVKSAFTEISQVSGAVESMRMTLRSFKKFISSDLVSDLLSLSREARLGTEKRPLTLLFSDIADFTLISEQLTSKQLEQNMSMYFGNIIFRIREHAGTIDKFIGDAVMAFWNAPRKCATHATDACAAALACRREVQSINVQLKAQGFPEFNTRFGLNSGECIVGNMGTDERMSYTAIGDTVNLASRIEAINKLYGTEILVSENTYWLAKDQFAFRTVDRVVVKGKTAEVQIYELVDARANLKTEELDQVLKHNEAMNLYFAGAYEIALVHFEQQIRDQPNDPLTKNVLARLKERIAAPASTKFRPVYLRS